MSVQTFNMLFGLFALLVNVFVLLMVALWAIDALATNVSASQPSMLDRVRAFLSTTALWYAWVIALVTTLGSLYYSEIAGYAPCTLCWYQRIAIYPMAIVLLVGALRKDPVVKWYAIPPLLVGMAVSIYHYQLEWFPSQSHTFCTLETPCTTIWFRQFGFMTLSYMALSAAAAMITLLLLANREPRSG